MKAAERAVRPPELAKERPAGSSNALQSVAVVVGTAALGSAMGTTQWMAAAFAYDPRLGQPLVALPEEQRVLLGGLVIVLAATGLRMLLVAGARRRAPVLFTGAFLLALGWHGPVYHPARLVEWWPQLRQRPEAQDLLGQCRAVAVALAGILGVGAYISVRAPRTRRASDSHGSAAWGSGDEFRASEEDIQVLREGGGMGATLLLGRHRDGSLLVLGETSGHLLTMASTRAGKGVGTVVPNCLAYAGSMIVTDPKAESFFATAEHRRRRLGQQVFALDPFEVTLLDGTNHHDMRAFFNPLSLIRTIGREARLALDRARSLTETLILESRGENAFWDRMARQVGMGFILYICYQFDAGFSPESAFPVATPYGRDLLTLRYLTTLAAEDFQAVLTHMMRSGHPEVRRVANILLGADERTRQNIMTSVQAQLGFLDSPQMAAVLAEYIRDQGAELSRPNPLAHADLHRIKARGVRQTVYLVVPPSFLETHAAWLRLMIVAINDIITRTTAPPDLPIVMMLDEFANLGRIDAVRRGVSLVGGYGVRFWMIVQDLQQVEGVYEKAWGTMFANASVKQLFGTNDLRTAKELSELTGDTTVYSDSGNSGRSLDSAGLIGKGRSIGEGMSEKGRRLLLPDEVLGMSADKQLLLVRGHRPLHVDKLNYLRMPEVQGLYAPNPMY